nr:hypothetical protein [Tanacetum cinerariifolium]
RRRRRPGLGTLCRRPFPYGCDAQLRPAARQRIGHAAGGHRAVGRTEAAAGPGSLDRTRAAVLRLGGGARPAGDPHPRRRLRRPAAGGR